MDSVVKGLIPNHRIKLILEYDGTNYHGWQKQKNAISVQSKLEDALKSLTNEDITVAAAGRTDIGVHALGQVVHFDTSSKIPFDKYPEALNPLLPKDIAVVHSCLKDKDFHARFNAKSKVYRYKILIRPYRSPVHLNRAWHIKKEINFEKMKEAATFFEGNHNFQSFCSSGHSVRSFERVITNASWYQSDDLLIFEVEGNGFLYNMVRIMVGTMVEIGTKDKNPEKVSEIIEKKDRKFAGITAPPQGLYLVKVIY